MQLFSFEYMPQGTDRWIPEPLSYKRLSSATSAARTWKANMAKEGCTVQTRVGELVRKGSSRVFVPVEPTK